jgi:hypothetical protein
MTCPICGSDNTRGVSGVLVECLDCLNTWNPDDDLVFGGDEDQLSGLGSYDDSLGDDL